MEKYSTVIIGGGAAGICAAISRSRQQESVIICEKTGQLGKKILATGNGRCNLLNENLDESYYNPGARGLVRSVFARYGKSAILGFFKGLGLQVYAREGRIFPVTNQASSVLKVLEMELKRLAVPVKYGFDCSGFSFSGDRIFVSDKEGRKLECRKAVITGGGKSYPAFGSDGSIYTIAAQLGHTIVEPVPSTVPLVIKDVLCHTLQGQRITAGASSIIDGREGPEVSGELLFTQYGLSGTCILDISEEVSIALNRQRKNDVYISVDMVPFMDREQLKNELAWRRTAQWPDRDMLTGILPNKFSLALKDILRNDDFDMIAGELKGRRFKVNGTRGWNEAEFTSGGVNTNEVEAGTLESKIKKSLFFAGEVLDVNGRRGGYNLGWAWASGMAAGKAS
ncbi:MAG: aminoacetone oxidase family FAD-binding enzyme [Dehalococcoidales bacterium]|nr:aminoacetone oxidase family FAD-binding enzyme [Dehalococcoidales bacterium]